VRFILAVLVSLAFASEGLAYSLNATGVVIIDGATVGNDRQDSFFGPTTVTANTAPICPSPDVYCLLHPDRAYAFADLATGKLGVRAEIGGTPTHTHFAQAAASYSDSLEFHLPSGMPSLTITLSMTVDAILPAGNGFGTALLEFGGETSFGGLPPGPAGPFSTILWVTATVYDGVPVGVSAALGGGVDNYSHTAVPPYDSGSFIFDALHTATLSIDVPAGVTYRSESGVFLTQVPEPSALQLLLFTMPGMCAASRFRRSRGAR
jgi:hypothetical protein